MRTKNVDIGCIIVLMDVVIALLLSLILVCLVAAGILVFLLVKRIQEQVRKVQDQAQQFFDPSADGGPSPFALVIQNSSSIFAGEVERKISAMMMGKASAISKTIDQVEEEVAGQAISNANPLLGALVNFSPTLKRKIARSPALGQALQGLSQGGLSGLLGKSNGGNHKQPAGGSRMGF